MWSRLNPDLLSGEELLPCMNLDSPPKSPASLVPFPVSTQFYKGLDPEVPDYPELLAQEKIRWCYQGLHRAGAAVKARIVKQLQYYNPAPTKTGYHYYWFEPNPQSCPYWPLISMIFPALENYRVADPLLPSPSVDWPGEAWQSASDIYGASLSFSAHVSGEDTIHLAASLTGKKPYWLCNYHLNPDRYSFIRQQLFYLLGDRMEPWHPGDLPKQGSFRGNVYRKPKKITGLK